MYSIAIVDDEAEFVKQLSGFIKQYFSENKGEYTLSTFSDGDEILKDYAPVYDIVFMDIEMERVNGMKTARLIRRKDERTAIIFVTRMARFALKGYEVNALDFIVKPLEYPVFAFKMKKAEKYVRLNINKSIDLKVGDKVYYVRENDIYYIESLQHNIIYYTAVGTIKIYGTLKTAVDKLPSESFCMCNRGYIVNMRYVEKIDGNTVTVHGSDLAISRYKKNEFMERLASYWGNRG